MDTLALHAHVQGMLGFARRISIHLHTAASIIDLSWVLRQGSCAGCTPTAAAVTRELVLSRKGVLPMKKGEGLRDP